MKLINEITLCYDDVLLRPRRSAILPKDAQTHTKFSRNIDLKIPLASSAMDTVTHGLMASKMAEAGGIGVIHKNYSPEDQLQEARYVKDVNESFPVAIAVGVGEAEIERARMLSEVADAIVIDTAHGHSEGVLKMIEKVKQIAPKVDVIAGNVATAEACKDLVSAGADGIKVGIGPGSICTTRVVSGVGVPQLQALIDCSHVLVDLNIPFIADGGIRHSGDIVKAMATGASCVMMGSVFAGCDESAAEKVQYQGKTFKRYRGMGSLTAMSEGSKDRYGQGNIQEKKKLVPEGIEGLVPMKGPVSETLYQLVGGLRSGMGYLGAPDLITLRSQAEFIRISSNSIHENHPHNILIDIGAPNYK